MTTTITTTQADMLRAAVRAKIAYWDALRAFELEMLEIGNDLGGELSDRQEAALTQSVDDLAAAVFTADAITHENAQEVFDRVRSA